MRRISPQDSRLTPVRYAASQGTGKDPTQLRLNGALNSVRCRIISSSMKGNF
jgi:hypothetical protein